MIRKFIVIEKEILYERKPLQNHGDGIGVGVFLFFLFVFIIMFLDVYVFLELVELPRSNFLLDISAFLLIVLMCFQCLAIVFFLFYVRDLIVKIGYGKFAEVKTFTTAKILVVQGESPADFIIQIFNTENEKLIIKTRIRLMVENYYKEKFLSELTKYKKPGSEKTDISILELIKLSKTLGNKLRLSPEDFTTPAQFDFNERIYSFENLFRTRYELIYSQKTKQYLFIDIKKGNPIDFQSDIVMTNVEDIIEYVSYDA